MTMGELRQLHPANASSRMPRVLFSFPTRIGSPGIGLTAWHQVTGLAREGVEIHVVTGSVEREMPGAHVARETMRWRGQKIPYRLLGAENAAVFHDWQAARLLRRMPGAFDLVHAWPAGAERTLRAARSLGIPALLERPNSHTAYAFEVVEAECERIGIRLDRSSPHARNPRKLAREQREFAAADLLLCPSEFVASTHAERGEPESRLLRHRYGYDPARFHPATEPRASDEPLVVAFVGRLEPRKGVHHALEAWRLAQLRPGARLILCGALEPGYESVIGPLLDLAGVEFVGPVADPGALMRDIDALVLPTIEEGSALVTYEARGSGAIVLTTERSGAYAEHGHNALIHPVGDVEALADHYRLLDQDAELRGRLRANSLDGVEELSWQAAAREVLSAYRIAAARLGSGGRTAGAMSRGG